jgi:hypothetical protein
MISWTVKSLPLAIVVAATPVSAVASSCQIADIMFGHLGEIGPDLLLAACRMGLEGLVSKRRDRPYRPHEKSAAPAANVRDGRGLSWVDPDQGRSCPPRPEESGTDRRHSNLRRTIQQRQADSVSRSSVASRASKEGVRRDRWLCAVIFCVPPSQ